MKNKINFLALIIVALFFIACKENQKSQDSKSSADLSLRQVPTDTLSLTQFNDYIGRWKKNGKTHMQNNELTYFSMPKADLTQFHNEDQAGVRYYMGIDSLNKLHIILVGTDANGLLKTGYNNHIYDVTGACPPDCGIQ